MRVVNKPLHVYPAQPLKAKQDASRYASQGLAIAGLVDLVEHARAIFEMNLVSFVPTRDNIRKLKQT